MPIGQDLVAYTDRFPLSDYCRFVGKNLIVFLNDRLGELIGTSLEKIMVITGFMDQRRYLIKVVKPQQYNTISKKITTTHSDSRQVLLFLISSRNYINRITHTDLIKQEKK